MNGINPIWLTVIATLVAIDNWIGGGKVSLDHVFPADWIPWIVGWCGFLGGILGFVVAALTTIISAKPGILISAPTAVVKAAIFLAVTLSFLVAGGSAQAQGFKPKPPADAPAPTEKCLIPWDPLKLCGNLTGKPEEDMQRVVKRIQAIGRDDMSYAILKATTANTNGSKVRLQCLQAIMAAKNAAEGTDIKDANGNVIPRPDPAVVTAIEDVAELVDALSPQGPLMTGCAGAAQLFKTNTLAAINAIVTGAAGLAAMPAGL